MVESKKRSNQAIKVSSTKQPLKQIKINKKVKKAVKQEEEQPIIEQPIISEEEEEVQEQPQIEEDDEDDEDDHQLNNNEEDDDKINLGEQDDDENDDENEEEQEGEEEQEEEEEQKESNKQQQQQQDKSLKTNEILLCDRFLITMANSFSQQLKGKNSQIGTLRGLYFESINQIKHESIRELLFRPKSWHRFYRLVKKNLKIKKSMMAQDDDMVDDKEDNENEDEEDNEEEEQEEQEEQEDDDEELSKSIFKNILTYEIVGGKESLIQQLNDSKPEDLIQIYRQSISLNSNNNNNNKHSNVISNYFKTSNLSKSQLLEKIIMYSLTLNNVSNEIIDIINLILENCNLSDKESNKSIYKSLRQFVSISILEKLTKNNISGSKNNNNKNDKNNKQQQEQQQEQEEINNIKSMVKLATNIFKFSLLNSSNSSVEYFESDYSVIKLLLGKSSSFLPKLVSMMTSFDFSQDRYIQTTTTAGGKNNISIFLNQFIQESKLATPPTNSISYLKSRILCERGIIVLTKLKDPLLTKLKISSATLPVPESLLNFFKDSSYSKLLVKTHKSMDDTQAIRLLKLNYLLEILSKIEKQEKEQKEREQNSGKQQEDEDDDDEEDNYIENHFVINKGGKNQVGNNNTQQQENDDDEENAEDQTNDQELEDSISKMDGTKSLLDFLDEDDLKSEDEEDDE